MGRSLGSTEPTASPLHFYHLDGGGGGGGGHVLLLHRRLIHRFGSIKHYRDPASHHALCSLAIQSSKRRSSVGWINSLCVAFSSLAFFFLIIIISGFFFCFSQRHCCCSSWRWRGGGAPGRCCPGLFGYGARGRGRSPAAAHPRGLPCGKPGNVE